MRVSDMDDKTRFKTLVVTTAIVTVGVLSFLLFVLLNDPEFEEFSLAMLAIAAVVIVLPLVLMLKVRKDLRKGIPLVDERGKAVKIKAGYYAFLTTIYVVLGFMYYDFIMVQVLEEPSLIPTEYFLVLDFIIIGIYIVFWWWFSTKGESTTSG